MICSRVVSSGLGIPDESLAVTLGIASTNIKHEIDFDISPYVSPPMVRPGQKNHLNLAQSLFI